MVCGFKKTDGIIKILPSIFYHTRKQCGGDKSMIEFGWLAWSFIILID